MWPDLKAHYSLKTTLVVAVSLMCVLMAVVVSVLPYQRLGAASVLILALLIGLSWAMLHLMKQASQSIQEQILRSRAVVNTAADAILGLNKDGVVMSANPACTSLFGRDESQILGQPVQMCINGLSAELLHNFFGEVHRDYGRPSRIIRQDFSGSRADGTLFPVQLSIGEVRDIEDLSFACIVRDMTDERAAQESSELYERALASSHNAVFIIHAKLANQPVVFINEAFQKVFGLMPHQVLGRNFEDVLVGHQTDEGLQALASAIREQRNTTVNLHLKLDSGRELHTKVTLSLVMSIHQDLTHFVGIISDVTAHVQAEQAIAERSAQLDTIFSLSPDGFVLFDEREHLMFANPAFERMTGRNWKSDNEFMTLEAFESELGRLCHHDHPMGLIAQWGEGGDPSHSRLQLARPQHRVVHGELKRNLVGRGETILYFRDITHEDEVDRMKSEFLASAAHELRTPMVSIFGFTELLLRRKYKEDRQADMLETIHRQSGLLVKMINELLDLARIESRRGMDLLIEAHPLRELVEHSIKGLMRKDTDRQVKLLEVPEVQVLIDPEKMQMALSNLLSNAFKYSPQGGDVTLGARVVVEQGKHLVIIEVQDQGIGMKPDQVARAFERFYRADASGNIPGTGLGLSLVKEIAELHNGRAELHSEEGQGTLARLYLPVDDHSLALTLVA
jgi:PAS domain S-box-containing protein